jgi:hypothetical protein
MSRSGYSDDCENVAMWRGQVASAIRGKRGQTMLRDLVAALDAMPVKALVAGDLVTDDGCVCALGALGQKRGVNLDSLDTYDYDELGKAFDIAHQLAQEVMYENDEGGGWRGRETPEERWARVRNWAAKQIRVTPEEAAAVELPESESVTTTESTK